MIAAFALLLQATDLPTPPADLDGLPSFPVPVRRGFDPSPFVRREVLAGRCAASADGDALRVDAPVAIYVGEDGVERIVPKAIDCPTVEQFTAGYVSTVARGGAVGALKPGWYRMTVTYRWTR